MAAHRRRQIFTDRYPFLGPSIWMATIEYFVIQIVVAMHFAHYSLRFNTISDLGNTQCSMFGGRPACSPWHILMNGSFVALGVLMASGAFLLYREFNRTAASLFGFSCIAAAGLGTIIVGLAPENVSGTLHVSGAALPFLIGNIGMIVLGSTLGLPGWLKTVAIVFGLGALVALGFFLTMDYGGLGIGGVERIVAYPQTVWLIIFGFYMSKSRWTIRRR